MNNLDLQYRVLLQDILDNGVKKTTRNGDVLSVFGRTIRYKFKDGKFPLLTTKKMYFKGIVTELLWFLRGDTSIKYLLDNHCHIWDGDCFANYLKQMDKNLKNNVHYVKGFDTEIIDNNVDAFWSFEKFIDKIKTDSDFTAKWGELGSIYGRQWRSWCDYVFDGDETHIKYIDQIADAINLLKTDPDSRRIIVNAWNPSEIDDAVLPPCHMIFQFYTRELCNEEKYEWYANKYNEDIDSVRRYFSIVDLNEPFTTLDGKIIDFPKRAVSLIWTQRSCDVPLGLPFNIASYGLLLEIVGRMVNMVPDELIGNLGDTHIYMNQIDGVKEQIGRKYTIDERRELLIQAMGENNYNEVVSNLYPFGGGMSEYFDIHNIPTHTREPYELPTLTTGKTDEFFNSLSEDLNLLNHLDPSDFGIAGYKSHPIIKYPLSN